MKADRKLMLSLEDASPVWLTELAHGPEHSRTREEEHSRTTEEEHSRTRAEEHSRTREEGFNLQV